MTYRIYSLDQSGRVMWASMRAFQTDDEAISYIEERIAEAPAFEVWQAQRLIGRFSQHG